MSSKSKTSTAVKIVTLAALAVILLYLLYPWILAAFAIPGFNLNSDITVTYTDGSSRTISSSTNLLQKISVIQDNGKTIQSISTNIYGAWKSTPAGQTAKVQYWIIFYLEIQGPFFTGLRSYNSLTGFADLPVSGTYAYDAVTDRWWYISNAIIPTASFSSAFYAERGSGLQVGQLNIGPEMAKAITDALGGATVISGLATQLTTLLPTAQVTDGQTVSIITWTMTGPTFYTNLKRCEWSGASINLGDFITLGAGKWMQMHDGDSYSIKFHVGYFFRWQDLTGEWTPWKSGDIVVSTLQTQIVSGYFVNMGLTVNGGVTVT